MPVYYRMLLVVEIQKVSQQIRTCSDGTLVHGILNKSRAILAKFGYISRVDFHQLRISTFSLTTGELTYASTSDVCVCNDPTD